MISFGNSLLQVSLNGISKMAFLLVSILLFKSIPAYEVGVFSLAYGLAVVVAVISEAGLRGVLIREMARARDDRQLSQQLLSSTLNSRLLTLIPYVLCGVGLFWVFIPAGYSEVLCLILVGCWFDSNATVLRGALRAVGFIVLESALASAFRLLLFCTVALSFVTGSLTLQNFAWFFATVTFADSATSLAFLALRARLQLKLHLNLPDTLSLLKRGIPFTMLAILGMIYIRVSLAVLGWPGTELALKNTAGFSLAGKIPDGVNFLPIALVGAAIPALSRNSHNIRLLLPTFRNLELLIGAAGILIGIVLVFFAERIIMIMATPAYLMYKVPFQIYGCTVFFTFMQYVYSNLLICLDQERRVAKRYGLILVINIILNLAFDWKWGVLAAASILCFCEFLAMALDLYYLKSYQAGPSRYIMLQLAAIAACGLAVAKFTASIPGVYGLVTFLVLSAVAGLFLFFHTHKPANIAAKMDTTTP